MRCAGYLQAIRTEAGKQFWNNLTEKAKKNKNRRLRMCTYRKVTLLVPSLCEPRRRVATGSSRTLVRPRCDFAAILVECVGTDFTRKRGLCDACQQWHGFDVDGRKRACVVKKRKEKQKKYKRRDTIILLIHLHQDFQKQLCIFEKKRIN